MYRVLGFRASIKSSVTLGVPVGGGSIERIIAFGGLY